MDGEGEGKAEEKGRGGEGERENKGLQTEGSPPSVCAQSSGNFGKTQS